MKLKYLLVCARQVEAKPWTEPVTAAHMFETIWPGTTTPATIADTVRPQLQHSQVNHCRNCVGVTTPLPATASFLRQEDLHFLFESCEKEKIKVVELALKSPPPTAVRVPPLSTR